MLKNLVETKLPTKLLIIADTENVSGQDLFMSALRSHAEDGSTSKINLICYENPPNKYITDITNNKIISYNYFTDPRAWDDPSSPKSDLSSFISDAASQSQTTFFIDSLWHFISYHGYCTAYKSLSILKRNAQKIICLVHCDLLNDEQIQELRFLASAFVFLKERTSKGGTEEKLADVVYRKSGGKVVRQLETFSVSENYTVTSRVNSTKSGPPPPSGKEDIEDLTTFKLGLQMSEKERKAKEELVLPYVKSKMGEIIYQPEADELEDDPDDDLDI